MRPLVPPQRFSSTLHFRGVESGPVAGSVSRVRGCQESPRLRSTRVRARSRRTRNFLLSARRWLGGDCLGNTDSGTGLKQARVSFWAFNPSTLRGRMARLGLANRVDPGRQAGLAVRAAGSRSYRSVMLRSCEIMEHMPPARITRRELFRAPTAAVPAPVDGSVTAPDTPGLGVELVMETIAG